MNPMYANKSSRRVALVVTVLSLLAVVASLGMLFSAAADAQSYNLADNSTQNVTDGQTVAVDVEFGDGWYNGTDGTNESTTANIEIYDNGTGTLLGNQTVSVNETDYGTDTGAITRTATFDTDALGIVNQTTIDVEILTENASAVQSTEVTVEDESADSDGGGGGGMLPAGSPLGTMDLIVLAVSLLVGTAVVAARRESL